MKCNSRGVDWTGDRHQVSVCHQVLLGLKILHTQQATYQSCLVWKTCEKCWKCFGNALSTFNKMKQEIGKLQNRLRGKSFRSPVDHLFWNQRLQIMEVSLGRRESFYKNDIGFQPSFKIHIFCFLYSLWEKKEIQ